MVHTHPSLQAEDAPSRQRWMEFVQQLNQKHSKHKKQIQLSPQPGRRFSSPLPIKPGGGFLGRLKKTLKKHQRDDGMDFSSFTAFGQALEDCPVSPDNKVCGQYSVKNWSYFVLCVFI